jgi:hypothetical protein
MPASQQHYVTVGQAKPFVMYRDDKEVMHWDGAFLAVLRLGSWIWFACLWARLHLAKASQRPPPLRVENFVGSGHWRN